MNPLTKFKAKLGNFVKNLLKNGNALSQKLAARRIETTMQLALSSDYSVSQQEYDAFRMKAIVLMKKDALIGTPLQALLKNPVQVKIGNEDNQKVVIQLSQRFEWAGRVYQFEGQFLRDPSKKMHSIPLSKSFTLKEIHELGRAVN